MPIMHPIQDRVVHIAPRMLRVLRANLTGEPMEDGIENSYPTQELRMKARRALVACGMWLRVGLIGASGVAAGLMQLVDGEVRPLSALALAVGGGLLAAASWFRARAVLESADKAIPETAGRPSAAGDRAMAGT